MVASQTTSARPFVFRELKAEDRGSAHEVARHGGARLQSQQRQKQVKLCELEANLVYTVNSCTARAT